MDTIRRRDVLAALLAGPAAALPQRTQAAGTTAAGLQLYTVRRLLEQDYDRTLARIAAIGYREVEFAGLYPGSPRQTLALLKRHGLSAPSGHASLDELERDLASALGAANQREQRFIVCPWIDEARRRSLDDWKRLAQSFNRIGDDARRAGLGFAYHNHDFEFTPIDGRVPYDLLLAETDPALVRLEIDLYWMTRAGRDPVACFQRHPGRVALLHLKDMARDGSITEVGRGTIDFRRILAHANLAGVAHCFVEHDDPSEPMQSIGTSLRSVQRMQG